MVQGSNSASIDPLVRRTTHYRAISKALHLLIGRGKRFSFKDVQRGAGVHERMIVAFRHDPDHEEWRECDPEDFASLVSFLGADFTSKYLEVIGAGQAAYDLPEDEAPPPGVIAADFTEDCATLARIATTGANPEHKPALKVMGTRMMSRGAGLVKLAMAA